MFLSDTILKAFDPPSTSKVYDTPPLTVSTPRWPRLTRLLQVPRPLRGAQVALAAPRPKPCPRPSGVSPPER